MVTRILETARLRNAAAELNLETVDLQERITAARRTVPDRKPGFESSNRRP